jgi:hypothetical protein
MMLTRIGQGNLTAVARGDVFIVTRALPGGAEVDKEMGVHLWHALNSERGIQKAVSLLAQAGLENMPEFALVHPRNNTLHVIVRGKFSVLLLNHDGRYSSVDSQGVATWREYTDLPASEWCIRGVPGLTLEGTEEFYLASGVSRVSIMASLGWDDPDSPMSAAEAVETGAIAAIEYSSTSGELAVDPAVVAADPPAVSVPRGMPAVAAPTPGGVPVVAPQPQHLPSGSVPAAPYEPAPVSGAVPAPATTPVPLPTSPQVSLPPHVTQVAGDAVNESPSAQHRADQPQDAAAFPPAAPTAPVPAVPAPTAQILQPLTGSQTEVPAPGDESNTVLTNNLVEIRQSMETNTNLPVPEEPITAVMNIPVPTLKLSNGVRIPLDRTVLIGRAPEASRVSLREIPRLVNVASPNNDVSRTHAQIRVEGEFVLVTDLNSTNGVFLNEPGLAPRRLHPDEPTHLEPGVIVDLGDGATFEIEEI